MLTLGVTMYAPGTKRRKRTSVLATGPYCDLFGGDNATSNPTKRKTSDKLKQELSSNTNKRVRLKKPSTNLLLMGVGSTKLKKSDLEKAKEYGFRVSEKPVQSTAHPAQRPGRRTETTKGLQASTKNAKARSGCGSGTVFTITDPVDVPVDVIDLEALPEAGSGSGYPPSDDDEDDDSRPVSDSESDDFHVEDRKVDVGGVGGNELWTVATAPRGSPRRNVCEAVLKPRAKKRMNGQAAYIPPR